MDKESTAILEKLLERKLDNEKKRTPATDTVPPP